MDRSNSNILLLTGIGIRAILFVFLFSASACGSATPTRAPATLTAIALAQATATPTLLPAAAITTTATLTPTSALTTTVTKTVAITLTVRPTKVPATPKPTTPRPGVLSGRVAYTVVVNPGVDFRYHTIRIANVDGSGEHQVLEKASWPAFSPDGTRLAYFGLDGLYIANSDGGGAKLAVVDPNVCCINWSRDGNWIAFTHSEDRKIGAGGDIRKVKVDGVYHTIVSFGFRGSSAPAFSPDGKQIAYGGCLPLTSTCGILVVSADGGAPRVVTSDAGGNPQWSPHGDKIVYHAGDGAGHVQVFVINTDGSGKKQLTSGRGNDAQPVWSRDGGHILWRSDQNGTGWAIFVMDADGSNPRKIISDVPPDPNLWGWESLNIAP